ncbi:MAG: hypothetical protein ACXQS8_08075, partial [Candidatus Helarchaeales archaeon]
VDDKTNPPKKLAELVRNFLRKIELATSIRELGIEEEKFKTKLEKVVEFAFTDLATSLSPRQATRESIKQVLQHAFDGKPVDF